jgi:signal transduction histidine kinase/ActR/RegA family two-component response regulator
VNAAPPADRGSRRPTSRGELEACVRDLMGLLALPALWTGRDPATVLTLLTEALEAVLPVQVCYAASELGAENEPAVVFRAGGETVALDEPGWQPFIHACRTSQGMRSVRIEATPLGPLYAVRVEMDYAGAEAAVCVGTPDASFPNVTQSALLRAAVSLAAAGLQSARLVREREEANRAKDEFLAMLGHELRNPLAPIVTALNLMKLRSGNRLNRESEIIERQVGHLIRLVDDLLDISRVARGKVELKREPVEMSEVVAKAIETASPLLEQRRHYLSVEVPATGLLVYGDPTRLAQVVANLLTNAAKYTEPGGHIAVRAWVEGARVHLAVQDNGAGISPDLLPRVFDLFQQGRRTMDRAEGGLGIGLALVKSLTHLHGGSVSARSGGVGRGSEFAIALPLLTMEPAAVDQASAQPTLGRAGTAERVLVVDDNHDAADLIGEMLRAVGHEVFIAHDAFEALSLAERLDPSVIVLDIGLPVMNGYDVARRIRKMFGGRAPRLIALTGYGLDHDRARSHEAGFEQHLVKPVSARELIEAVEGDAPRKAR